MHPTINQLTNKRPSFRTLLLWSPMCTVDNINVDMKNNKVYAKNFKMKKQKHEMSVFVEK